jgi:hypothetical protein
VIGVSKMKKINRWFNVPEKGKECKWLRILGLDMGGNHQMTCRQPHDEDECPCSMFVQIETNEGEVN